MQTAEHHREQFELAYATAWAKDRDGGETPEQLAAEVKAWRVGNTYEADFPRLRFGWEGYQWARASQCLAQIEEPAQPVAEICSASHDDAQFGERAIKPLCDISGFEYGTPLYAGTAPAAGAPQGERQWICPTRTVADLANNLLTMDQALPIYGAQYIEKDGRRCAIAVPPTVSRERVQDGRWIGQGEELNAAVVWTRAEQPVAAPGLTDGQLDDESYRVNDEPGFADAFRAGARFAERVHGVTASAARAVTGKADWWRGRADEIEAQVARSGSSEAMRCYTDMRTLLQAAAAPQAPNCTRCSGSGEDPVGYLTHGHGPDDHTVDGPCRECDGSGAAPQAPAAPWKDHQTARLVNDLRDCAKTYHSAGQLRERIAFIVAPLCDQLKAAQATQAAPAAPAVDASDTALLDAMERERIAVIPEFEGPWDAQIFGEDEAALACGSGTTPRKAIAEALASLEARKDHDAAQAAAKGANDE